MEYMPLPLINKKILPMVMEKSVRYSCAIDQKPFSIRTGYLVVINATIIINKRGTAANRVRKPIKIKLPHSISNEAVNCAQNSGFSKPIFANRPAPTISGNKNFCIPSNKKTAPTMKRIRMVVFELSVCNIL